MKNHGFSLVELLIIIFIIGVIAAIAVPQYGQMMRRRGVEKQMREIQSDISNFRLSAMHTKEQRTIQIGPRVLQFVTPAGVTTKNLPYEIQRGFASGAALQAFNIAVDVIAFDERGYTNDNTTVVAVPVDIAGSDNCLVVHTARTNIGRMIDATNCQAR